jgi:hypothetical protein
MVRQSVACVVDEVNAWTHQMPALSVFKGPPKRKARVAALARGTRNPHRQSEVWTRFWSESVVSHDSVAVVVTRGWRKEQLRVEGETGEVGSR